MMHEKDDVLRATRLKQLSTSAMIVVAVVIVVIIASENNPTGNQLSVASGSLAALIPVESLTAHGIYAYDVATGEMLYGVGENEELAIGSTTKIATALVVLDYASPDDEIVIDQTDLVDTSLYSNM